MPYRIVKNEVTFFASELIDTPPSVSPVQVFLKRLTLSLGCVLLGREHVIKTLRVDGNCVLMGPLPFSE